MKRGVTILLGLAGLRVFFATSVSAACCRRNLCLRDILAADDGLADCSSNIATTVTCTVTPKALTVYETVSQFPIDYTTEIKAKTLTIEETIIVSTQIIFATVTTSSTAATEINLTTAVETATTATETQTVTATMYKTDAAGRKVRRKRNNNPALPNYATAACTSFAKYSKACACAGAAPTTITVTASLGANTVTITETDTILVLSTVVSTAQRTETVMVEVVDTVSATTTEVALLTATLASTTTTQVSLTTTVSVLATQTAGTCLKGVNLGAFRAYATPPGSEAYTFPPTWATPSWEQCSGAAHLPRLWHRP